MNFIMLIVSTAEIAIATIILWYVVDLLTTMPANMRMVVKCLIVLVAKYSRWVESEVHRYKRGTARSGRA